MHKVALSLQDKKGVAYAVFLDKKDISLNNFGDKKYYRNMVFHTKHLKLLAKNIEKVSTNWQVSEGIWVATS